ncbi:DUF6585 family protein [Streptomyces sp. WI04-05B]|uniref:DUF6585 family protein n=1 Tax=Streptomyces TaxID=1883 RepID=UPI0029B7602D|nr:MULTISPECIES: DUF6585 family protein [unclassified Streptomyces]MDX2543868.1 hypothetical protein [Streptomyces sp. WI04-05B]MDX2582042.1 hypothetical protein [Streptomyces sp. WI04-05A]MDX3752454.1 hypothetical protein [Streptomyces sp. AK08-02]
MTTQTLQPPSPEVAALAARHQLGVLEASFAPKRLGVLMFIVYLNMLFVFSAFFLVPGLVCFWWLRRFPNFSRKQARKRLHLFEHGMIVQPQFGDGMTAFRWDSAKVYQDITQLFINGVPSPVKYVYSVSAPSFGGAEITEFYERPEAWGPWLQEAILRAQGQAVLDSVLEGGTADFGSFSVSRSGVAIRGKNPLPWSEVHEIQVRGGAVHVMKYGTSSPWFTVTASGVSNLHLFLTIAENLYRK